MKISKIITMLIMCISIACLFQGIITEDIFFLTLAGISVIVGFPIILTISVIEGDSE